MGSLRGEGLARLLELFSCSGCTQSREHNPKGGRVPHSVDLVT